MAINFHTAERRRSKLRIGISGPSGSGKTYSALLLAHGITKDWTKVYVIDTEQGSADLYSDLGQYNVASLEAPFSPERYIEYIKACEAAGAEVIIIDSVTHEWDGKGGLLESNELIAQTKFKGNTWSAWSQTTPRHQKFIDAITSSKCHIITTARSKTDTIQTEDKKIKKVGLKEIQREGFEYELTINFSIDREKHYASASKDRTGLFIDRDPFVISASSGEELAAWNDAGAEPILPPQQEAPASLPAERVTPAPAKAPTATQLANSHATVEKPTEGEHALVQWYLEQTYKDNSGKLQSMMTALNRMSRTAVQQKIAELRLAYDAENNPTQLPEPATTASSNPTSNV